MKKITRILSFLLALVICAGGAFTARADEFSNVEKYGYYTETLWDRYQSGITNNERLIIKDRNKGEYQYYTYEDWLNDRSTYVVLESYAYQETGVSLDNVLAYLSGRMVLSKNESELESITKVFAYFQQNWTYDYNESDNLDPESTDLLAQRGVCDDYAYYFGAFLNRIGFKVAYVGTTKHGHGYNYVSIGNTFYLIDATWGWEHFLTGITNDYPDETHKPKNVDMISWNGKYYSNFNDWKKDVTAKGYKISTTSFNALPKIKAEAMAAPKVTATKTDEGYILDWAPVDGATFYTVYSAELSSTSDYYIRKDNKKTHITNERVYYTYQDSPNNFTVFNSYFNAVNIGDKNLGESEHYRYYVNPSDTDSLYYVVAFDANGNSSFPSDLLTNNTLSSSRYAYQEPEANYIDKTSYINCFFDRGNTLMDVTDDICGYTYGNLQEITPKSNALILNGFAPSNNASCKYKTVRVIKKPTATEKGISLEECEHCLQRKIIYTNVNKTYQNSCKHTNTYRYYIDSTCTEAGEDTLICTDCFKELSSEVIAKKAHTYNYKFTDSASQKSDGKDVSVCTSCGYRHIDRVIPKIKTIKISKKEYTYNNKKIKPTFIIKDRNGKALKYGQDYKVRYSGSRKKVGTCSIYVEFCGDYTGSKMLTAYIKPRKTKIKKLYIWANVKGSLSIRVARRKEVSGNNGYQYQLSTNKNFTKNKKSVKSIETNVFIDNLKSGKKYYVRVRTYYVDEDGKKHYSKWSKVKTAKTI